VPINGILLELADDFFNKITDKLPPKVLEKLFGEISGGETHAKEISKQIQSGSNFSFQITHLINKDAPDPDIANNLQFLTKIIGHESDGIIMKNNLGLFKVVTPFDVPQDSKIIIELQKFVTSNFNIEMEHDISLEKLLHSWDNIEYAIRIAMAENHSARCFSHLPQTHMPIATLFGFIAAIKKGDIKSIISEELVQILHKTSHSRLIKLLTDEFTILHQSFAQSSNNVWQGVAIPFFTGEKIEHGQLFVKENLHQDADGIDIKDTRFILEMEFAQMGFIQFDGLMKQHDVNKNLNLIMRAQDQWDNQSKADIIQIFKNIVELTNISGNILFQVAKPFPVNPRTEIVATHYNNLS
jgi:hypothetical protein